MTRLSVLAALVIALAAARPVCAQLPVATGKSITMSNAAWKIFIPSTYQQRPGNVADVLVHFHGDPQTYWNNARYAHLNAILVTVNYSGLSSAYSTPFSNASLFQSLLDEALTKVRNEAAFPDALNWDQIGVSSFSAGYGAVREILKSATYLNNIDALLSADSLYANTAGDGTPLDSQMVDYKTFALAAKAGTKTFLYSHSQVPTYTYEETRECGDELMQSLGLTPIAVNEPGLGTLQFYRKAEVGNFHLWGATGSDVAAHSKHLQFIGGLMNYLPLAKLTPPAADFDDNYTVNAADLAKWRSAFASTALADSDGDGDADGADFLAWQRTLGSTVGAAPSVASAPEPNAMALVALAGCGTLNSRKTRRRLAILEPLA